MTLAAAVTALEAELTELQTRRNRLEELTRIEEEKTRALLEEVEIRLGKGRWRERAVALFINCATGALFFFLGRWVG